MVDGRAHCKSPVDHNLQFGKPWYRQLYISMYKHKHISTINALPALTLFQVVIEMGFNSTQILFIKLH